MTEDKLAAIALISLLARQGDQRSAELQNALQWHFLADEDAHALGSVQASVLSGDDDKGVAVMVGDPEQLKRWRKGNLEHFRLIPINPPPPDKHCRCCGQLLPAP